MEGRRPISESDEAIGDIQVAGSAIKPVSMFQDSGFYSSAADPSGLNHYEASIASHSSFQSTASEMLEIGSGSHQPLRPFPWEPLLSAGSAYGLYRTSIIGLSGST
jgi:hypothetical protein